MKPSEVLEQNREAIRAATTRHKAANPRVFGSVARGEDGPDSDLDILIDALPGMTLFDLGGLQAEMEDLLSCRVDVVTASGLKARMCDRILAEARTI